jgi:hypothetical protein
MTKTKWVTFCGAAALAMTLSVTAPANSQSRNERNYRNDRQQNSREYRDYQRRDQNQFHRFDDRDRRTFRDWYTRNRNNAPWRHDRVGPNIRFRPGVVVGREYMRWYRPVPYSLAGLLPVAPRGFRYVMIGDQIVLLDNRNVVHDGFSFQFNF